MDKFIIRFELTVELKEGSTIVDGINAVANLVTPAPAPFETCKLTRIDAHTDE